MQVDIQENINKIYDFATFLQGFKKLKRFVGQYFWRDYPISDYESDADHSWRMGMMLIVLEPHLAKPIDFKKAMTMALIHDVPELIAGDRSPLGKDGTGDDSHAYSSSAAADKQKAESDAAKKIFGTLPSTQAEYLYNVWSEYEDGKSYEAQVVAAIDKLEGKLQTLEYTNGIMFKDHHDFTMKYGVNKYSADPATELFGKLILEKLKSSFSEFNGTLTKS